MPGGQHVHDIKMSKFLEGPIVATWPLTKMSSFLFILRVKYILVRQQCFVNIGTIFVKKYIFF